MAVGLGKRNRNGVTFSTFVSIAVSWAFAVIVLVLFVLRATRAVVEVVLSSQHLLVSLLSILTVCMSQGPAAARTSVPGCCEFLWTSGSRQLMSIYCVQGPRGMEEEPWVGFLL